MSLKLHNTLTRTKEEFVPIDPSNVRMYVCGPTVYDFAHIGNARPLIVFDVLYRLLKHLYPGPGAAADGSRVTYVRNITDVDDKIIVRAAEEFPDLPLNEAIGRVTRRTTQQFHEDVAALGCLPPTVEPRATDHIEEMKAMIEELIAKGYAYVAEGHVLFRVSRMKDYGKLSNRTLDEMVAGARVEVAPYKQDPMDFVLWKPSKPGEPAWPSPAGINTAGRPGWHLECSAMSDKWLWEEVRDRLSPEGRAHAHEFDIHGGGIDLVFPHHENEIAQSRCAHGTPLMARYWMHNGFLQVEGEKMSKSLGNFVTINELLMTERFGARAWLGPVLRLAMLMTHYREPIDFSVGRLAEADSELVTWSTILVDKFGDGLGELRAEGGPSPTLSEALSNDLNTPEAISDLRQRFAVPQMDALAAAQLLFDCEFLGLFTRKNVGLVTGEFGGVDVSPEQMVAAFAPFQKYRVAKLNGVSTADAEFSAEMTALGLAVERKNHGEIFLTLTAESEGASEVLALIAARAAARKAKKFAEADRIRAELDAMGIALKDSKDPATGQLVTTWEVKR